MMPSACSAEFSVLSGSKMWAASYWGLESLRPLRGADGAERWCLQLKGMCASPESDSVALPFCTTWVIIGADRDNDEQPS